MGMAIGDIVLIQFRGSINDQVTISNFHYRVTGMPTVIPVNNELDNILQELDANAGAVYENFRLACPGNWACDFLVAQRLTTVRSVSRKLAPTNQAGARMNRDFQQSNAVITRNTDFSGRSQVSTLHLPGISGNDAVSGETTPAYAIPLNSLASSILSPIAALFAPVITPVIYHRGKVPDFDTVTAAFAQPHIRTMRRRVVGRGI